MKVVRIVLAAVALVSMAGLAYVAQQTDASGNQMVSAAQNFLSSLGDEAKTKAAPFVFPEAIARLFQTAA